MRKLFSNVRHEDDGFTELTEPEEAGPVNKTSNNPAQSSHVEQEMLTTFPVAPPKIPGPPGQSQNLFRDSRAQGSVPASITLHEFSTLLDQSWSHSA